MLLRASVESEKGIKVSVLIAEEPEIALKSSAGKLTRCDSQASQARCS